MAVTLKKIAEEAGVSIMAVSSVLNSRGNSKVSAATRARILEIARKLDYHPDSLASAIRTGIVQTVGVITNWDDHGAMRIASEVLCGIQRKSAQYGYSVHLFDAGDLEETFSKIASHRIRKLILICVHEETRRAVAELCRRKSISLVFANGPAAHGFPGVIQDNRKAMYDCVSHLISLGHKKIGLLCSPHHIYINSQRHLGYEEALRDAGITPDPAWANCGCYPDKTGVQKLFEKIRKKEITAVASVSCSWASDLLRLAVMEGLSVPRDLSIVTMCQLEEARLALVPFTFSTCNPMEIGHQCCSLLLEKECLWQEEEKTTVYVTGILTPMGSTSSPEQRSFTTKSPKRNKK